MDWPLTISREVADDSGHRFGHRLHVPNASQKKMWPRALRSLDKIGRQAFVRVCFPRGCPLMTTQLDPPRIGNSTFLRSFVNGLVHRIGTERFGIDVFTGQNNAGKSFIVRLIQYHAARAGLLSVGNIPHSPKENLNPRILEKLQSQSASLFQTSLEYHQSLDPFDGRTKADLTNAPFSEVVELLRVPEVFACFQRVISHYFLSEGFLGNRETQITVERRQTCRWNMAELEATDPPYVLCVDGEHFHWSGIGSDRVIFLLGSLLTTSYLMEQAKWKGNLVLLLDEPETGLSVGNQRLLLNFLLDIPNIVEPGRIKRVIVSTHSHVFLPDRSSTQHCAFLVERETTTQNQLNIHVRGLEAAELLQARFDVLGLSFEDLLFEAILIVEGKHESNYLRKLFAIAGLNVAIIPATTSNAVVNSLLQHQKQGDRFSPAVIGLLDSPTSEELPKYIELAATACRYVILSKPGIEYFYPTRLIIDYLAEKIDALRGHYAAVNDGQDWTVLPLDNQISFLVENKRYKRDLNAFSMPMWLTNITVLSSSG